MVRFTLATTVLVSLAATSAAFQPARQVASPRILQATISANDMMPTPPATPPPQMDPTPKQSPPPEMDMKGIAMSVSRESSATILEINCDDEN